MIDKQKLIQWVEDTYEISSHPADEDEKPERVAAWKAEAALMYKLKRLIEFGNFDVEEVAHERSEASSKPSART